MAYEHHHELSATIVVIALSALLVTVKMDLDTSVTAVGIFGLYWIASSLYFKFFLHHVEERMFLMVTGTIYLFLFLCLLAFLSRVDLPTIALGILLSSAILLFPISHSIRPSDALKRIAKAPHVKRARFIPFSSCLKLDVDFPNPLYVRDALGSDDLEASFYLKHAPKTHRLIESGLVKGVRAEGDRVSLDIDRKKVMRNPRVFLSVIQRIAEEL